MNAAEIFSFENLMEAHRQCRQGKQHKRGTIMFEVELGRNLAKLSDELAQKVYRPGKYKSFTIYDPKKRLIEALPYRDRVVLMCFCRNVLEPKLERRLVYDNAASRIGKGTAFAIDRLHYFMHKLFINLGNNGAYFLKCDISKYFQNINHEILLEKLLNCGFSEDEMWFMRLVIQSHGEIGVPLGNQTSQWFALLYLDEVDRLIKERLRARYYVRYMDDFILLSEDKAFLQKCRAEIGLVCKEKLHLELNNKTQIGKLKNGLDFLGFNHKLTLTGKIEKKVRASAKRRRRRYIRAISRYYLDGLVDDEYIDARINTFKSHLKGTKEWKHIRNRMYGLKHTRREG